MQGIYPTFDDGSLDRGGHDPRPAFLQIGPGVIAVAALSACIAWALHPRPATGPGVSLTRSAAAPTPAPGAKVSSNPYGDIFFDPRFLSTSKLTWPTRAFSLQATL